MNTLLVNTLLVNLIHSVLLILFNVLRDTLIYAMSASMAGLPDVVELLSEAVLQPVIAEQEVSDMWYNSSLLQLIVSSQMSLIGVNIYYIHFKFRNDITAKNKASFHLANANIFGLLNGSILDMIL